MFISGFSNNNTLELHSPSKKPMNRYKYKNVRDSVLVSFISSLDLEENYFMFMQDGVLCHSAKSVQNDFRNIVTAVFTESESKMFGVL